VNFVTCQNRKQQLCHHFISAVVATGQVGTDLDANASGFYGQHCNPDLFALCGFSDQA